MRVLIVEDEHKIANTIRDGLQQNNFAADVAYDGEEGFDLASTEDYDNLCEIKGVGPKMAEKLYANGIRTLAQIAEMSAAELKALDKALNANGKVIREHWAKQAKQLLGL